MARRRGGLGFYALVFVLVGAPAQARAQPARNSDGDAIYRERCIGCHEGGVARAPDLAALRQMSPDKVLAALTSGTIWDVDTTGAYRTVNGVAAHGGSIDGPGAVIVGGMLYVNSGYRFFGTAPGNVLLAFSIDGT